VVILQTLAVQVITGLSMGWIDLPGFRGLLSPANLPPPRRRRPGCC